MTARGLALISLGCTKNLADSEDLVTDLRRMGFVLVPDLAVADLVLINTCGFVEDAKRESIDHILEAADGRRPGAKLVVAGCLTTRYATELAAEMPEVDRWLPFADYARLPAIIAELFPDAPRHRLGPADRSQLTPPHYAWLKIAEGCSKGCHFCAIPLIRGPHRSRPLEELVRRMELLRARGVREVALISQHLDDYGRDLYGAPRLAELIRALAGSAPEIRIRCHYVYPDGLSDAVIAAMADCPSVCHYLDVPVQHASDRMLARMGRRTTAARIAARLAAARAALPDLVLRTSLLVGHPGEREEDVALLLTFLEAQRFDLAGCFRYSVEEGTVSANLPGAVAAAVIEERYRRVMELQARIHGEHLVAWQGREVAVVVDERGDDGVLRCRHYGQAPEVDNVTLVDDATGQPGDLITVRIIGADGYDLIGARLSC